MPATATDIERERRMGDVPIRGNRLRRTPGPAALLVLAHIVVGCQAYEIVSPQQTSILVNAVQVGMSEDDIIRQLAEPQTLEDRGATKFFFYRTDWINAPAAEQRSPIAIAGGKVVGLGKTYYQNFVKSLTGRIEEINDKDWNTLIER
jgi:hypothetical protein